MKKRAKVFAAVVAVLLVAILVARPVTQTRAAKTLDTTWWMSTGGNANAVCRAFR